MRIDRQRVRSVEGRELMLPSVARFSRRDPLTERIVEQILLGVSMRRYQRSLEPLPPPLVGRGTSKSAVREDLRGRHTAPDGRTSCRSLWGRWIWPS